MLKNFAFNTPDASAYSDIKLSYLFYMLFPSSSYLLPRSPQCDPTGDYTKGLSLEILLQMFF